MVFSVLILNLLGTISTSKNFLWIFSLKNNWEIFVTPRNGIDQSKFIGCIDGLKIITALWLMIGHRRGFFNHLSTTQDIDDTLWWTPEGLFLSFVTSYSLGVDIFLITTTILATQLLLGMFER